MQILLIDDSSAYGEEFADLLADGEFADAAVEHCTDAAGGMRAMMRGKHDITFVDYRLPGESGLDLIRRARSAGFAGPIICLTGFGDPRLDREAEAAGANFYLSKGGFSAQFLSRTIRYALRNAALVADLAAARDHAQQASEAKSRFLAAMSHELRTPLSGILGYAHLLRLDGGLSAGQTARVDAMLKAGSHLLDMINCVLDLSAIEADRLDLQLSRIDPRAVVVTCLDLVRPAAAAKALQLQFHVAPEVPDLVLCDPTRLRQIVVNLVGNAVKFASRGAVVVSLRSAGDAAWCVEVADTGPGVAAEQQSRLFQDFQRCHDPASFVEGAGLGLAVSSRLAVMLGGTLGYQDNPGGGSMFTLVLPREAAASESRIAGVEPPPRASPTTPRLRILVVDDVSVNLEIATAFLESGCHDVTCAQSGAEAIKAIADGQFDVVLMDVRMPAMDGLEATRRVRALGPPRGSVPIIGLTAQAYLYQVNACIEAGMNFHLSKPYDPPSLLAAVARAAETPAGP